MIKLTKLDATTYSDSSNFYRSNEAKAATKNYFSYVYTACLDYIDTGDVNILNSVVVASKYVNRARVTKQLISLVAAHNVVNGKYKGKANTKRLKMLRAKPASELKEKQETIINSDTVKKEAKASTFDVDQTTTRAVNALAALFAHGIDVNMAEILKEAHAKEKEVKVKTGPQSAPVRTPAEI